MARRSTRARRKTGRKVARNPKTRMSRIEASVRHLQTHVGQIERRTTSLEHSRSTMLNLLGSIDSKLGKIASKARHRRAG